MQTTSSSPADRSSHQTSSLLQQQSPSFSNKLPTIGLITEGLSGQYQSGTWQGIVDAAREHKVNIISFCGGSLAVSAVNPWDYQGNVLYEIAQHYPLDGLIIAGSVGCYVEDSVFREFLDRYRHLKIITIAPAAESVSSVNVDNQRGMRSVVSHLVICHSYKKIAFIKGPDRNIEAESRFVVFKEVMECHKIPVDPQLVLQGDFTRECGAAAVRQLISSSTEFDAIVAANDDTALGALAELQMRGVRVPDDVALVGFDDSIESGYVTPPLTTVHQPLYDLGRLAVEKLLLLLKGEEVPMHNIVEAQLVIRQSCGCFHNRANDTSFGTNSFPAPLVSVLDEKEVVALCLNVDDAAFVPMVKNTVSAFCRDVNSRADEFFLRMINRIFNTSTPQDHMQHGWYSLFHALWRYSFTHLEPAVFAIADELLHRAIALCGTLCMREQGFQRIESARESDFLREIGYVLNNTLDIDKLMDAIAEYFPFVDVNSFYLSLYECPGIAPAGKSRLKYAMVRKNRKLLGKDDVLFETMALLPPETVLDDGVHIIVAEALYFQKEQFGIALFDSVLKDCGYYHTLKEYISGAMHSAALIKKVRQQTEVLSTANAELIKLREEERAYLKAIKRELELGRKIQMGFLPQQLPQVPGWEIAAAFEPAREVSGDFYDAFNLGDSQVALVIADVSGKDVSAALFMSLIRTLVRVFAERAGQNGEDPLDAVKVVNDYILQHHFPGDQMHGCMYATILFGILQPESGEFRYVNAGHLAPLIISTTGEIRGLAPTGMAVGLAEQASFVQKTVTIEKGELFFMYTDGVTEAKNPNGDFFTKERLRILLQKEHTTVHERVKQISAALHNHTGGAAPYDDITILAAKRE